MQSLQDIATGSVIGIAVMLLILIPNILAALP